MDIEERSFFLISMSLHFLRKRYCIICAGRREHDKGCLLMHKLAFFVDLSDIICENGFAGRVAVYAIS